jgi:hypothetical protein
LRKRSWREKQRKIYINKDSKHTSEVNFWKPPSRRTFARSFSTLEMAAALYLGNDGEVYYSIWTIETTSSKRIQKGLHPHAKWGHWIVDSCLLSSTFRHSEAYPDVSNNPGGQGQYTFYARHEYVNRLHSQKKGSIVRNCFAGKNGYVLPIGYDFVNWISWIQKHIQLRAKVWPFSSS